MAEAYVKFKEAYPGYKGSIRVWLPCLAILKSLREEVPLSQYDAFIALYDEMYSPFYRSEMAAGKRPDSYWYLWEHCYHYMATYYNVGVVNPELMESVTEENGFLAQWQTQWTKFTLDIQTSRSL